MNVATKSEHSLQALISAASGGVQGAIPACATLVGRLAQTVLADLCILANHNVR